MKVVSHYNLPAEPPIMNMVLAWLFLERIQSPGWVFGVVFSFYGFLLLCSILCKFVEEPSTPKFEEE